MENDIHVLALAHAQTDEERRQIIKSHYQQQAATGVVRPKNKSALIGSQRGGHAKVFGVFGGQGNNRNYFEELRVLYDTYQPLVEDLVRSLARTLQELCVDERVRDQYPLGLDVLGWLHSEESTPLADYLISAPVSFPLIGLLQLVQITAICMALGCGPEDLPSIFEGLNGHSQGVVVAVAAASATNWTDFQEAAVKAVTILFWIGARCQQAFIETPLSSDRAEQLEKDGYGRPMPMLAVNNIARRELEQAMSKINGFLAEEDRMAVSLVNSSNGFVVSGPERTLAALVDVLKSISAKDAQARVPFSQRRPNPSVRFLPITIPCHCSLLSEVVPVIEEDLAGVEMAATSLTMPVNRSVDGTDLRSCAANLVPTMIRLITSEQVDWPQIDFSGVTHAVDFGPGGTGGIGALTHRNNVGNGLRVLVSGKLDLAASSDFGGVVEVFNHAESSVRWGANWADAANGVSLVRTAAGTTVDSKLSRLLGLPPFLVAGMTPTTTHPEFCAAVMRAGYHVEFAAGGYHSPAALRGALARLRDLMPAGRAITVNVIYINPRAMAWQIPLIRELRASGFPIGGLTIGGGVPSVDVASEYITTLGLDHISFKPGSVGAINSVVEIARRNPSFPIILQWTGGRGGGHHSYEDFHAPMLETYAEIRKCRNLVLVAGSGFGSAADVRPYLSGEWSLSHGRRARMPFDGVLFGSRVMTCLEAKTSPGVKAAIAAAPGISDEKEWERTYAGPAGGIVTVISEMGEPIHVVSTRGALLWAEMDKLVFKLDKSKRLAVLEANKAYITEKLNLDFQKPWFGRRKDGAISVAVDLCSMTYLAVLERMVELMFVRSRASWVDASYSRSFLDFVMRTQERLGVAEESVVSDETCLSSPAAALAALAKHLPEAAEAELCTEDVHYFLQLCRRPGQKPVPFVPVLDDNFESYFKKDSLWQSEDLEAVVDQDAGRTFILHGPVAARWTCKVDEPVKDVLDGVNDGTIQHLVESTYGSDVSLIPQEEFLCRRGSNNGNYSNDKISKSEPEVGPFNIASMTTGELGSLLSGGRPGWRSTLFGWPTVARNHKIVANPVQKLVFSAGADTVEIGEDRLSFYQNGELVLYTSKSGNDITVMPFTWVTASGKLISLAMRFEYHPETPYAPLREAAEDREQRIYDMYRQLWLGDDSAACSATEDKGGSPEANVFEDRFVVEKKRVQAFNRAIDYHRAHRTERVAMDFAIVAAWKPISQALLQDPVQGDLLALVHLSNSYEVARGARPLEVGDEVRTRAYVTSIIIDDSGKTVEVACELRRAETGVLALTVRSRFLFRGSYDDFSATFARTVGERYETTLQSAEDVAVLASKPWFKMKGFEDLQGTTLEFVLHTFGRFRTKGVCSTMETTGDVFVRSEAGELTRVATVSSLERNTTTNQVMSYLARSGARSLNKVRKPLRGDAPVPNHIVGLTIPRSNEAYSRASGDVNPIHTSPMFAALVDLPGTITHGMYCSAAVRGLLERHVAGQRPERVRSYDVSFVGMVLPGDELEATFTHKAMADGLKVVGISVARASSGEKVLSGEALVAQPTTTVLFTGQGSQEKGMGMDLYESSPVARAVWDRAEVYFRRQFGLSILDIVRRNPTSVRVTFGGVKGRILRKNYQDMFYEAPGTAADGVTRILERRPVFPTITENTTSFTHSAPKGLLFATQFAQPALTIMELAAFRDMQEAGAIDPDCSFAGHSLGEYAALAAITDFMPFDRLLYIVFCRGMTMQLAVERDSMGRSDFGMIAVDPARVGKGFTDASLNELVSAINTQAGFFIEIVNLNIRNNQYVAAGDLRALDMLQRICDGIKKAGGLKPSSSTLADLVSEQRARYTVHTQASSVTLARGAATVPLPGVDVPFHSSFLRPRMEAFRRVLLGNLEQGRIRPDRLVGKYIPNVMGRPFGIDREYVEDVLAVTKSERVRDVVNGWDRWMDRVEGERVDMLGASAIRVG